MDNTTHVIIARYFLLCSNSNKNASMFSLLPMIDKHPSYLHRLYAHCLINVPILIHEINNVLEKDNKANLIKNNYMYKRISEELPEMKKTSNYVSDLVGDDLTPNNFQYADLLLSVVSHIYLDTFNNPVQPFVPKNVYCSGQWDFWYNNNFFYMREKFYDVENLKKFWNLLINYNDFNWSLNIFALIESMIREMARMSTNISEQIINDFLLYLQIRPNRDITKEMNFLRAFELKFIESIKNTMKTNQL